MPQLGGKTQAIPGRTNQTWFQADRVGTYQGQCAELCGLWHGYMFNNGKVVDAAQFSAWAKTAEANYAPIAQYVPKYSHTYLPDPQRRAG